jgi:hypothetical protein
VLAWHLGFFFINDCGNGRYRFTIILGHTAEMINTSIEAMTDQITKERRKMQNSHRRGSRHDASDGNRRGNNRSFYFRSYLITI